MIIIPPKGMSKGLAKKLLDDSVFAHMWLCHNARGEECPDGCDTLGNPKRTQQYQAIELLDDEKAKAILEHLIKKGSVYIDSSEYVGIASDGIEVHLGTVGYEESLYRYLLARPTPDLW